MLLVKSKSDLENIKKNVKEVHLVFRPSIADLINIKKQHEAIEVIELSATALQHLSKAALPMLAALGVEIRTKSRQGQRKAEIDESEAAA